MIAVGVDTHKDSHYAVALDQVGQIVAELSVPATSVGYAELQRWAEPLADADELVFGLEGVGSWGRRSVPTSAAHRTPGRGGRAPTTTRPTSRKVRSHRRDRRSEKRAHRRARRNAPQPRNPHRRQGLAHRPPFRCRRTHRGAQPDPSPQRLRTDRLARTHRGRHRQTTQASAPGDAHTPQRQPRGTHRVRRHARPRRSFTRARSRRQALPAAARRTHHHARSHAARRGGHLRRQAPRLRSQPLQDRGAFARCNGTAPIPASSGKTVRYRLNPGGDRQANNAIHTIAIIRAKHQPETRAYLERRIKEGKTRREALRSLKRHISRELYHRLAAIPLTS